MTTDLRFKPTRHQPKFLGRNGEFKCKGIEMMRFINPPADIREPDDQPSEDVIMIRPVTSHGVTGRCFIEVPTEEIPALISQLTDLISRKENE